MKNKKKSTRLKLNKSTISNLHQRQMGDVKGGGPDTDYTCGWCDTVVTCLETLCPICLSDPYTLCC